MKKFNIKEWKDTYTNEGNGQCNCGPTTEGPGGCDCEKDDEEKDVNIYEGPLVQEGSLNERDETDGALDKIFQILHKDLKYPLSKASTVTRTIEKLLRKS